MNKTYIALAEDNQLMRNGLSLILQENPALELTHVAKNGKEIIDVIGKSDPKPHIVLMDIDMPILNGFEASKQLTFTYPDMGIIFLTSHISKSFIENAIYAGGHGYLSKNADVHTIFEAIEEVQNNGFYYNEFLNQELITHLLENGKIKQNLSDTIQLTSREIDFLKLICLEKTDAEIAKELNISPLSADTYRKNLMRKIGVRKSIGLAIYAIQKKII